MASQAPNANHSFGPDPDQRRAETGLVQHRAWSHRDTRSRFGRQNQRRVKHAAVPHDDSAPTEAFRRVFERHTVCDDETRVDLALFDAPTRKLQRRPAKAALPRTLWHGLNNLREH